MNKNLTVTKRNDLNNASYKLTLDERRLILSATSKIDSDSDKGHNGEIHITTQEFSEMWDIDPKVAYKQLKDASVTLYQRSIELMDPDTGEIGNLRWIYKEVNQDTVGYVKISLSPDLLPYLTKLKGHFTTYRLLEVKSFKSSHAIRLYELLMQFKNTGWRQEEVSQLKKAFGVADKYSRWAEFRRNVIDKAIKEINSLSNYHVQPPILVWRGRAIHAVKFVFSMKAQTKIEFDE